jgi:beta-barrel assembly-enhancing protease
MIATLSTQRYWGLVPAFAVCVALAVPAGAQTKIIPPSNKYSLADDVQLGQEASAEVRKELPLLDDGRVDEYVEDIGRKLVAAIPPEFAHSGFRYSFDVVNQKEINAFALPGGPMYLNRGMIEAAKSEGEMAGVMAHEISHVALRHGTAQATKGQKFQIGSVLGQVAGAVIGGTLGNIIGQGTPALLGTYFLKYGREYETQADLLGAQMLARAGYDPREMANMFKTIEAEGARGGPEWLSSHPNPGNRYNAITREAQALRVQGNANSGDFQSIKARLGGMSPAMTAEQIAKNKKNSTAPVGTAGRTVVRVEPPSAQYRTHQPSSFLRVNVPANWEQVGDKGGVTYAPEGAFFRGQGDNTAFTHGIQIGVTQGGAGNLQRDTDGILNGFIQSNPQLRRQGGYSRERIGGRAGLTTVLSNVSEVTGQPERVLFSTTQLRDGSVLYMVGVTPQNEARTYDEAFRQVRQSLQIADR